MGEKEKLDKKNIILAILALILAGVVVLIVLSIMSLPNGTSNPFFKVTYNVIAVDAKVEATYQEEGSIVQKYFKNLETNEDYIEFNYQDGESTTKSLSMTQELELREYESHYVLFSFKFTNRNRNRFLVISMEDKSIKENVVMYYATSQQVANGVNFADLVTQVKSANNTANTLEVTCDKATSNGNAEVIVYALFNIQDEHENGAYQSSGANQLQFTLTSTH